MNRFYTIAGHPLRLRFAGQALVRFISPALEHVASGRVPVPSLTVCIWDSASTEINIPPFPWEMNSYRADKNIKGHREVLNPIIYFKDETIRGAYEIGTNTLSMLNTKQDFAIFWVPDGRHIHYYERSSPLRTIFQWWAQHHGLQLLHAGAIGTKRGGILLAGKGGTGKSTVALSCLNSELSYLSDDYCLVAMDSPPYAYSVYSSAKIDRVGLQRFPHLLPAVDNKEQLHEEKGLLFLNQHYPAKIATGFPVRALLLPCVTGLERTTLTPASPRNGLMALAPSTIFQLRGASQEDLTCMATLTRLLPSYIFELGKDTGKIPAIILEVLSKH